MPTVAACAKAYGWSNVWVECHPGTAAWVAAIATIFALIVAIGVPIAMNLYQRHAEKRDRKLRAAALLKASVGDVAVIVGRAVMLAGPITSVMTARATNDWADKLVLKVPPRLEWVAFEAVDVNRDVLAPIVNIVTAAALYNGMLEIIRQSSYDSPRAFERALYDLDVRRNKVVEHAAILSRVVDSGAPLDRLADPEVQRILNG
jgi:hypothetical protein